MSQNRFMKNPKITLFLFLTLIFITMLVGFEKYLAWAEPELMMGGFKPNEKQGLLRHIRLREREPLALLFLTPEDEYIKGTDTLVRKEYRLQTDEDGFIYPSRVHDNPDVKIFFLGGSTTECRFVGEQNRFPYLVGRLLENDGRKVNTYNSGVSADNTLHLIDILLNKIIPYDPDIVVMMENINDLTILMYEGDYWNRNPTRGPIVYESSEEDPPFIRVLKGSKELLIPHLARKVKPLLAKKGGPNKHDEFAHIRGKKININKEYLVRKYKNNLQTFINICKANGIVPVLMTQANRFKAEPDEVIKVYTSILERDFGVKYSEFKGMFDTFNEVIRNTGAANNVLVIDLANKVPQEKEYMYDYDHYNDNGSKFAAKIIASELLSNNIISPVKEKALPQEAAARKHPLEKS